MLESTARRLLSALPEDAVVLDVGGWADPFERADWVIDVMPYETRGLYEREGWTARQRGPERFTCDTWIQRDLCDRAPFPFAADQFDFAVCSQTLEDIRDPVWVCSELARVARAGYVETPSRLEEQSWGVSGPFVGWAHHHWLVEMVDGGLQFVAKPHSLHSRLDQHFPDGFWQSLGEDERVVALWWEQGFQAAERLILDSEESDAYFCQFVARELAARGEPAPQPDNPSRPRRAWRRLRSTLSGRRPGPALEEPWRSGMEASLLTPLNLYFLHELTERLGRLSIQGDIVECGVYRGGSAAVLGWSMMRLGDRRSLWLLDSFEGMPAAGARDGDFSRSLEGKYVGSEEQTRALLERVGVPAQRYRVVRGPYERTFASLEAPPTALLHVDCDFYEPVRLSLEKFYPRLAPGGFVVLNDYGIYKGAREATDEFLAEHAPDVRPVAIDVTAAFFQKPGEGYDGVPVAGHPPGWPGPVA